MYNDLKVFMINTLGFIERAMKVIQCLNAESDVLELKFLFYLISSVCREKLVAEKSNIKPRTTLFYKSEVNRKQENY